MPRTWRDGPWTPRERSVVLGIVVCLLAVLSYRYFTRPADVPAPLPPEGPRASELVSTIDPNEATWEQIALLPGIGEKKAKAIIEYREQYRTDRPGEIPFRNLDDLTNIKGIGDTTVANLSAYLSFPTDPGRCFVTVQNR
jgi:competence ComEA-like helix-hairpin-helix protein